MTGQWALATVEAEGGTVACIERDGALYALTPPSRAPGSTGCEA